MVNMVKEGDVVGVAEAKAKLSALLERVARGDRVVVAKRGRPVAVLVPPDAVRDAAPHPRGLASLAGVMTDWPDMERDVAEVVRRRRAARDREAPDLG